MKIRLIKINVKIIFLSICFILFSINSFGYNSIQDGKIINIIDGDTVHFLKEGDTVYKKIRLVGIDAPELKQEFGKESRQCLVELIENQPVHLVKFGQDRYQRILAKIKIGQVDINLAMIKKGVRGIIVNTKIVLMKMIKNSMIKQNKLRKGNF